MTGRTINHDKILEKLGEGGMGVVFKARDHHLDRFVALKVLHPDKVADADRRQRFTLEAKAASALNHPNIITIYDIARVDEIDYIAMEYVKGHTLHSLIGRRGLPVSDVLKYGIQISDAVAAAHSAGIVHRDLKPANVMLADHGIVKVLDFGLAKLTGTSSADDSDNTRTLVEETPATEEGQVLGTIAYMSPEQLEGKKVDERTDVFAFGAMLYELITGQRAFDRGSRMATITAVLKEAPRPLTELSVDTPPELEKIVSRCLRKEPDRRSQTMLDVKNSLLELKEDTESGRLPSQRATAVAARNRLPVWGSIALVATAAVASAVWWKGQTETRRELVVRQLTADVGLTTDPVFSRDGKLVAYASDRATQKNLDIWMHPLTQGAQPLRVTSNEADDQSPDFSPDGGLIVFQSKRQGGGFTSYRPLEEKNGCSCGAHSLRVSRQTASPSHTAWAATSSLNRGST
jgi:serine/threonine protein kinase